VVADADGQQAVLCSGADRRGGFRNAEVVGRMAGES